MDESGLREKLASLRSSTREEWVNMQIELQHAFETCTGAISARTRFDVCVLLLDLDPHSYFPQLQHAAHDLLTDREHPVDDVTLLELHQCFDMGTEWVHASQTAPDARTEKDMAMRELLQFRALGAARRILNDGARHTPQTLFQARRILCSTSDDCEEVLNVLSDVRAEGDVMNHALLLRNTLYNSAFPITERVFTAQQLLSQELPPSLRSGMLLTVIGFICADAIPAMDGDEQQEKELGISVDDVIQYVEGLYAELAKMPDEEQNRALALAILCRFYANLGERQNAEERYESLQQFRTIMGNPHFYSETLDQELRDAIDQIGF